MSAKADVPRVVQGLPSAEAVVPPVVQGLPSAEAVVPLVVQGLPSAGAVVPRVVQGLQSAEADALAVLAAAAVHSTFPTVECAPQAALAVAALLLVLLQPRCWCCLALDFGAETGSHTGVKSYLESPEAFAQRLH